MPINIPDHLPARSVLEKENIFVMGERCALRQDIRPLRILLLNLMPDKPATEAQICRCLSNTPLQIEISLLQVATHTSKTTSKEHLLSFYKVFDDVKDDRFDGMIVTGAPVEHMPFEEVDYWPELCNILDWSRSHVYSSFYICWGAQAALYRFYGIGKLPLPKKLFGVFEHAVHFPTMPLVRGFDDCFLAPHSRHTSLDEAAVRNEPRLAVVSSSPEAGAYIVASKDGRQIFVTGHSEYDAGTLGKEYRRDLDKGLPIEMPVNYFPNDDPDRPPPLLWRAHSNLLYCNWLNYYVYQETPYNLDEIK